MNLVSILLWFVLFLFLVGFFVVVWKAASEWRWYNIVAVCIAMLLAVIFMFPTARVLKSRAAWHEVKEQLEKDATLAEVEHRLIKYGDPTDPNVGEGVVDLDQKLSKLDIEAGRRWRNLVFQGVADRRITLVQQQRAAAGAVEGVPGADGAAPAAAAPALPLVPQGLVVYCFAETPNEKQVLVPTFYLGEFRAVASTPTSVTLTPTGPLEPLQRQAIETQKARSWSLYELLPLDGHEPWIAEGSDVSDDNCLGRIDTDLVDQLLGNRVGEETLQAYRTDGRRADEKEDEPLSRWWKVEFIKNHAIDVDSPEQAAALDGGFFDNNGRAVDGRLQRGEDGQVRFKVGDSILVKEEAAQDLVEQGVVELRDKYFLRPLNDYRFVLRRIRLRLTETANRTADLEFEKKVLEEAVAKTEGMIVSNQEIRLKLEQDLTQFRVEKKAITTYTEQLEENVTKMREEMIRLHQENQALEKQVQEKHLLIEKRLDSVTLAR